MSDREIECVLFLSYPVTVGRINHVIHSTYGRDHRVDWVKFCQSRDERTLGSPSGVRAFIMPCVITTSVMKEKSG